jgi:hypothetical protein
MEGQPVRSQMYIVISADYAEIMALILRISKIFSASGAENGNIISARRLS